jgi:hypothetical protein
VANVDAADSPIACAAADRFNVVVTGMSALKEGALAAMATSIEHSSGLGPVEVKTALAGDAGVKLPPGKGGNAIG